MLLNLCKAEESVFKAEFRNQIYVSISVLILAFSHGITLGWCAPNIINLSSENSALGFFLSIHEASWVGSYISIGGFLGTIVFAVIFDRFGSKISIYALAVPQIILWVLTYFATSVEFLYAARIFGGMTGGGLMSVTPVFLSEIADITIRGKIMSLFALNVNCGTVFGYILATYLNYHLMPCIVILLPIIYLGLAFLYPETPQSLLRKGRDDAAEKSYKFYKKFNGSTKEEIAQFQSDFTNLKLAILKQKTDYNKVTLSDYLNKKALKAFCSAIIICVLNTFNGYLALVMYMSNVFAVVKTDLNPNTNTIMIGFVQILGVYLSTFLVDRFGRRPLLMMSTSGMGISLAVFGVYAFISEETDYDLSAFSAWCPLLLVSLALFFCSIGIVSLTVTIIVEVMPVKIRANGCFICIMLLSLFAFVSSKLFLLAVDSLGLAATMWFTASVCAFGLFYITIFLEETKGKSMNTD